MIVAHKNRKREKEGLDPAMVAEEKGSLALKLIKDGNKRGRLTSLTESLQYAGLGYWLGPETRDHQRAYEKQKQEDEKVKQHKNDKRTHQFIDEVDALCNKCDPKKWKSIHDCTKPQIKTMVKWLSRPGDEKCIDKKGEMWARYQEIKDSREDDRSHLAQGETITTTGNPPVAASASQTVAAGAGDAYSISIDTPAPVAAKRRNQNQKQKQKAVPVPVIAIKNTLWSSINDSKISGSNSDFSDL
jgi:hypothetical protein